MTAPNRTLLTTALLVFVSVLSSTLLIPAVRPFMALHAPKSEGAAHAFMALGLLGAVVAAPFAVRLARRFSDSARLARGLALLDALVLAAIALVGSAGLVLGLRFVQGGLNLALLSLLLGAAPGRSRAGARYGLLGTAMMLAVALGAPLGGLCLSLGPRAALLASAALELSVAAAVGLASLENVALEPARPEPRPWLPIAWVFCERLAIGLFVVTFSFHARQCLGLADAEIGLKLAAFMLPFVLAVHPAGLLAERLGAPSLGALGLALYGLGWLGLRLASAAELLPLLALLGVSSAAVFSSALCEASVARGVAGRIQAMSALNSAGSLGMLLGTAGAGLLSALLRGRGASADTAHGVVFVVAGVTQLTGALLTVASMAVKRGPRLVRN